MGKAAVELPDPLDAISPDALSSVDDLLAQMAGEEIDRLLSESDAPREKPEPPTPRGQVVIPPVSPRAALPANDLESQSSSERGEPPASSDAIPPQPFHSKEKFVPTSAAEDVRLLAETLSDEPPVAWPVPVEAPAEDTEATTLSERSGLEMPADEPMLAALANLREPDPLPIYLKPLEWLSAPLEMCPDAIRQLIGKIALLTTFNAAAVLVYVFIFRKR